MAWSLNRVELIGNVGKDPEIRNTQGGQKIVNLSLATSESWTDKNSGERRERTEWHRVVIFDERLADVAERFIVKGSKVFIEGQLQTREWTDQSGQKRYSTEVVVQRFHGNIGLLSSGNNGEGQGARSNGGGQRAGGSNGYGSNTNYTTRQPTGGPQWDAPKGGDLDDEIPF